MEIQGIKTRIGSKINIQMKTKPKELNKPEEVYAEDVQIIIKDGKYYLLHELYDIGK